jgi:hypothetical protein
MEVERKIHPGVRKVGEDIHGSGIDGRLYKEEVNGDADRQKG